MEFSIKHGSAEKLRTGCIVVGVYALRKLSATAQQLDAASDGYLSALLKQGDMDGRAGTRLMLHKVPGVAAERVLLIGLGKADKFHENAYRNAVSLAIRCLDEAGSADALLALAELSLANRDLAWCVRQAVQVSGETLYRFDQHKTEKPAVRHPLRTLSIHLSRRKDLDCATDALQQGEAIATAMAFMKDLANQPGNICTPTWLATQADMLAQAHGLGIEVLGRDEMQQLGMHALLAVAQGSHRAPHLIVLRHAGGQPDEKPVVLVGKGVTFDSGGISLKPAADMDEMKFDMSGAASVMAAIKAAAQLRLPLNIVAIVPAVENMPGGGAARPGDIVASLSGRTVEILNTDAEGRLILCDALTYAARFDPACVIDVATLTGACIIALGHVVSGLLANDEKLARALDKAGQTAWDRTWQLPLLDDYQEQLKSNFADIANIGGRPAGTITAAAFLSRFTEHYAWAHLDIAGTAWKSGKDKGSTGRPVPLLIAFLIDRAALVSRKRRKRVTPE